MVRESPQRLHQFVRGGVDILLIGILARLSIATLFLSDLRLAFNAWFAMFEATWLSVSRLSFS